MKTFFDSSVLIAAMIESEAGHEECRVALSSANNGFASTHTMAECFAIISGGRIGGRLLPGQAAKMIKVNLFQKLTFVELDSQEYQDVMDSSEKLGVRGGAIYDALILAAARKFEAEEILTLNLRHFLAFAPDLAGKIRRPG